MKRITVAVLLMMALIGASAGSEPFAGQALTLSGPAGTLELRSAPFELRLTSPAGKPVLTLVGGPSFTVVRDKKAPFTGGKADPGTPAGDVTNPTSGVGGPSFSGVGSEQALFTGGKADPGTTAGVVTNPTRGVDFIEWEMAAGPNDAPVRMRATLASPHGATSPGPASRSGAGTRQ